ERVEAARGDYAAYIAGEGAASGYLSAYLNRDTLKLLPLSTVVMVLIMTISFRTRAGVSLPFLVATATLAGAVGLMAGLGVPYFVITNALPAILIGIAVADSVHILSHYYETKAALPEASDSELAVGAASAMWRPITLTTLTTIAGFTGIVATSSTPPMMWFGVFAIVGILVAYGFSLAVIPAGLSAFGRAQSRPFAVAAERGAGADFATRFVLYLSQLALARPRLVIAGAGAAVVLGAVSAAQIRVDSSIYDQFKETEAIVTADRLINERFHGSNFLDIVIETPAIDGLTQPEKLAKIEQLQAHLETLPHVNGTTSIVDHIKKLNQALNRGEDAAYTLPANENAVAQQLFLLTASSDPAEWRDDITTDQNKILVRAIADTSRYVDHKEILEAAQTYLDEEWREETFTATMSGAMVVSYHRLEPLLREHILSLLVSLALVYGMSGYLFRSASKGLLTLAPVVTSVLTVYAIMGLSNIQLDVATSMFAAIAVGLGIDFAIHMVDRIDHYRAAPGVDLAGAIELLAPASGRALFYNFATVFFGFSVVGFSELPIMQRFGGLVAASVFASFFASIMLIPAFLRLGELKAQPNETHTTPSQHNP
ncbi:MAG: MMPL family transporter, partial [Pseudomonadota bacterium]